MGSFKNSALPYWVWTCSNFVDPRLFSFIQRWIEWCLATEALSLLILFFHASPSFFSLHLLPWITSPFVRIWTFSYIFSADVSDLSPALRRCIFALCIFFSSDFGDLGEKTELRYAITMRSESGCGHAKRVLYLERKRNFMWRAT